MTGSSAAAGGLEQERIALVPVGSTEQHGPAGVPGGDSYVAITLAGDVARRTGVLCTPRSGSATPPTTPGSSSSPTSTIGPLALGEDKGRRYHDHTVARRCELLEWLPIYDGPVGTGPAA
ncbi:creatininase family protein [Kocuria rhizosphaericola]|uniref:creatininase family protein n=1 Tax=Kocuria rhizosphaericola TaxID=3376284 RepID=UPI0037B8C94A